MVGMLACTVNMYVCPMCLGTCLHTSVVGETIECVYVLLCIHTFEVLHLVWPGDCYGNTPSPRQNPILLDPAYPVHVPTFQFLILLYCTCV